MPTEEWLQQYESVKDKLICPVDLETYFSERIFPLGNLEVVDLCNTRVPAGTIGFGAIEVLDAGTVHFPTGEILACDPTPFDGVKGLEDGAVSYKEYPPFFQKVPAGTFPVQIAAITTIYPSVLGKKLRQSFGYLCAKVVITDKKPVRYELGVTGRENLGRSLKALHTRVASGSVAILDAQTQREYHAYWKKRRAEAAAQHSEDDEPVYLISLEEVFDPALEDCARRFPRWNSGAEGCGWADWHIPEAEDNICIFNSCVDEGFHSYFGYDENGALCGLYLHFTTPEDYFEELWIARDDRLDVPEMRKALASLAEAWDAVNQK